MKADWEGESVAYNNLNNFNLDSLLFPQANAATGNPTLTYIKGNYNGIVAKTQTGTTSTTICLIATPSIVVNTGSSLSGAIALEITNLLSGSLLTQGGDLNGTPYKSNLSGAVVYCSGALPSTIVEKTLFAS